MFVGPTGTWNLIFTVALVILGIITVISVRIAARKNRDKAEWLIRAICFDIIFGNAIWAIVIAALWFVLTKLKY